MSHSPKTPQLRQTLRHWLAAGLGLGLTAGFAYGMVEHRYKRAVWLDVLPTISEYVDLQPPTARLCTRPTNGYITVNGSTDLFYACKPGVPYDPYHYSERGYGVAVFESGDEIPATTCESIKIHTDV